MSLSGALEAFFANGKETMVSEPIKFKARLGIGEKAFKLLRAREHLTTFTEALGVGAVASTAATSTVVATSFFAPTGMVASALSFVGLGTAAVTPVGWALAAGVLSSAAYVGVSRFFERSKDSHLIVVPKFINTPLEVIALALIELMLPVSLKIAKADGAIVESERKTMLDFYHREWGYSEAFLLEVMAEFEGILDTVSYTSLARSLGEYCAQSKDCDPETILADFLAHLMAVVEADGTVTDKELGELALLKELLNSDAGARKTGSAARTAGSRMSRSSLGKLIEKLARK
jgi:uncharacterized tellurite resistance protein B-like protein